MDAKARGAEGSPGYREVTQPFLQSKGAIVWILNDSYTSKGLEHGVAVFREDGTFQRQGLVGSLRDIVNRTFRSTVQPSSLSFSFVGNEMHVPSCPLPQMMLYPKATQPTLKTVSPNEPVLS